MSIDISTIFQDFKRLKILVVGDVMLDEYYIGDVTRISPEAPVPIVSVNRRERRLGGAANVAFNLRQLGATPVLCSVRGNDVEGEWMHHRLEDLELRNDGMVVDINRPTTVKTRIIGNKHQVLRVDQEDCSEIGPLIEQQVIDFVKSCISEMDALVFQDYNKGLLTKKVISSVTKIAQKHDVPILVDPKRDHFLDYKGVTLFKPNRKEIIDGLKLSTELKTKTEIETAVHTLAEKLNVEHILLTLSEMGVAILHNGTIEYVDAHPRKIVDVSGAGDSVISVAALAVALKLDWSVVAELSNLAGGLVCERVGVVPIDLDRLVEEAKRVLG